MKSQLQKITGQVIIILLIALTVPLIAPAKNPDFKNPEKIKASEVHTSIEGIVQEKIDASNYSYLRLKVAKSNESSELNEDIWVAVPQTNIKINAKAMVEQAIPMFGYESKTLKRKFDHIYFGVLADQSIDIANSAPAEGHWVPGGSKKAVIPAHPGIPISGEQKPTTINLNQIKVKKAEGPNAVTIAELFSKKVQFSEKTISIRGKIIKYNGGILGKNWIHIADGTGAAKDKNNDVTVVSVDNAKLGDVVLITGKVVLDKKLDPYFFPIAIEDAQVKIQ